MKRFYLPILFSALFSPQSFAEGQADRQSEAGYGNDAEMMHMIEMVHQKHGPTAAGVKKDPMHKGQEHPRRHSKHHQGRAHYEEFNDRAHQRKRIIFGGNN